MREELRKTLSNLWLAPARKEATNDFATHLERMNGDNK
jgi:hypothetical protein